MLHQEKHVVFVSRIQRVRYGKRAAINGPRAVGNAADERLSK